MNYSTTSLTQITEVNTLLTWAAMEKGDLEHKRYTELRNAERYGQIAIEVDAAIMVVNTKIETVEIILNALPEGPDKQEYQDELTDLIYQKERLERRKKRFGKIALIEKENEVNRTLQQLEEMDALILMLEDRKTFLENQARA